ncbi:MAG TPA: SCO family protein [Thermoanaerobaculia bacterium]|nr:SCO family protein [Thermoanaerobaculia bacterium]
MRPLILVLLFPLLFGCGQESSLPRLFPVPNASLIDENGRGVELDSMKGSVTVYDFIFTSCEGICPIMSRNMAALTKKVPKEAAVRFVSITVDPERDTPEVLRAYASRFRNDERWTFLTGEREAIIRLSVDGFKLAAGDPEPGGEPLLHSSKFAVADREGIIREYYGGTDGDAPEHLAGTVRQLLRE